MTMRAKDAKSRASEREAREDPGGGNGHCVLESAGAVEALLKDKVMNEKKYAARMKRKGRARIVPAHAEEQVQIRSMDSYQRVAEVGL